MKKGRGFRLPITVISMLLLFITACPLSTASAHLVGQPPFFQINGIYSNLYPVPTTSLSNFDLPQDLAPDVYLLNKTINFHIDLNRLPQAAPDVIARTKFTWDFGDGNKANGLSASHSYSNMGSYILTVYADDGTTPTPQLIESVLLNIVPSKSYQLPKAVIEVNDHEEPKNPASDILSLPFGKPLRFDGSKSTSKEGKIISYQWDFGDQKTSSNKVEDHYYPADLTQIFPLLRIKDSNGFIADNYVQIQNSLNGKSILQNIPNKPAKPIQAKGAKAQSQLPFILGGVAILVATYFMVRLFARGHYHGKHPQKP